MYTVQLETVHFQNFKSDFKKTKNGGVRHMVYKLIWSEVNKNIKSKKLPLKIII